MTQPRMLRTSERISFKTCRQKWWWGYRDHLKPEEEGPALRLGDLVHRALAVYYKPGVKRGPLPAKTFERLYHEDAEKHQDAGFSVYTDEKWEAALPLGIAMLEGYVERFKDEDAEWKVLASEQTFQVPLKVDVNGRSERFTYVGTLDGAWKNRASGRIIFKEFKTAKQVKLQGLALDEQAGGYWTYAPKLLLKQGILKEGENIDHILYTFLRKAAPDPSWDLDSLGRKLNKDGSVSKQQPAPFFVRQPVYRDTADRENVHRRVLGEVRDMILCEESPEQVYKNPGPLHMPNCMGCQFKDMCELHETGQDWEAFRDASYVTWDPYADHELAERH